VNRSSQEGIWFQSEGIKDRTARSFPPLQRLIILTIKMQLIASIRELSSETFIFWFLGTVAFSLFKVPEQRLLKIVIPLV